MFTKSGPAYFLNNSSLLIPVKAFIYGYLRAVPGWHSVDEIFDNLNPVVSPILAPRCPRHWTLKQLVAAACGDLARDHVGVLQTRIGKNFHYQF